MSADLALRFAVDALAIGALAYGVFLRRHGRMDLVVTYVFFNVGLFLALVVISAGEVSIGVGFGLFAVLSIVRLRSEPFSNRELAYFFVALVLGLVCGIDLGDVVLTAILAAVALLAAWAIDHPRLGRPASQTEVVLELVFADRDALHRHLEERLDARVIDVTLREVDYVRETTRACVRYVPEVRAPRVAEEDLHATVRAG